MEKPETKKRNNRLSGYSKSARKRQEYVDKYSHNRGEVPMPLKCKIQEIPVDVYDLQDASSYIDLLSDAVDELNAYIDDLSGRYNKVAKEARRSQERFTDMKEKYHVSMRIKKKSRPMFDFFDKDTS